MFTHRITALALAGLLGGACGGSGTVTAGDDDRASAPTTAPGPAQPPALACAPGDLTTGASFELAADAARGAESPEAALAANPAFGRAEPQAATSSTGRREFRRAAADDDHAYLVHELAGRAVSWVSATRTSDGSWTLDSYLACNTFFVANGGI